MPESSSYHAYSPYGVGPLRLFAYGRYAARNCGGCGRWELSDSGELLHLKPDDAPWVELRRDVRGFVGANWRLVECQAAFEGFWNTFDPAFPLYAPLAALPLKVTSVWGSGPRDNWNDVVVSGENAKVEVLEDGFQWKQGGVGGRSSWFFGIPKIEHPRALHVPHFYDYWCRLGNWKPARKKREPGIAFVARNLGRFGDLSMRRLEVARQLSRWFPVAVSEALKGAFDANSKAVCWEVPSSVRGKYEFLSRFAFNLCFENSISPGYLTEKLFDAVYSGCVPLYEGDPGFADWFDDSGVINCSGLNAEEIADRIRQAESEGLQERIDNERDGLLRVGFAEMMHRIESFAAGIGAWAGVSDTRFHHKGHSHTPPPRDVVALKRGAHSPFANLTVVIKAFLRPEILARNIAGFREVLGESCPIIVVDDSRVPLLDAVPKGVRHVSMPFDSGVSSGRNLGVALANTEFVFIVDDDCLLQSSASEVEQCLSALEQGWDVVGSGVCDFVPDEDVLIIHERVATLDVQLCDITYNFFVARREVLLKVPWDEDMKVSPEHAEHFLRLRANGVRVGGTKLLRFTNVGGGSAEYRRLRGRGYFQKFSRRWGYSSCFWEYLPADDNNIPEVPAVPKRIKICVGRQPTTRGWLNVGEPTGPGIKRTCDLHKPLPFADDSIEMAWIDRGLEKLSQLSGVNLLSELHRVLAPGGVLRLATFDLGFLIRLASGQLGEIGDRYVKWAVDSFIPTAPGYDAAFVMNHQMRSWGHKFLHDETTLADALESTGFEEPIRLLVGQSSREVFQGIEAPARLPEGFAMLETLVLEARKPFKSSD